MPAFLLRQRAVMFSILAFMHAITWWDYSMTSCLPNFIVKLKLVSPLKVRMKTRLFYFAHPKLLTYGKSRVIAWCELFQDWGCSPDSSWRHPFRLSSQPQKKKLPFCFSGWVLVGWLGQGLEPTSSFHYTLLDSGCLMPGSMLCKIKGMMPVLFHYLWEAFLVLGDCIVIHIQPITWLSFWSEASCNREA